MLDRRYILENVAAVTENCTRRGAKVDVAKLVEMETKRRDLLRQAEDFNRQANDVSKKIGQEKDPAKRDAIKAEGKALREKKEATQAEHDKLDAEIDVLQKAIPNLTHPAAPTGADDTANTVLRFGKTQPPKFDFKPLDHVELGKKLDMIDFEAGARTTGQGFYFLKNDAVLLDLALQRYALDVLLPKGFQPVVTPDLARNDILVGIGFNPRGPETQIYSIEQTDLSLVGTAEITLGGMYAGETLDEEKLPIKLAGISHCFRTEAGAAGRASKGLYRVHQFTKVEMFAFTLPEQSDAIHDELCALECELFDNLGIAYRVVDTASGDLGGPAYRKFDLEAWMPGRGDGGEYGEVTSTSNCTDYQSRRLNIRYKKKGEKGTHLVHTLNGTAIALSRGIISVMENYQTADGKIRVPEVLKKYVGKDVLG